MLATKGMEATNTSKRVGILSILSSRLDPRFTGTPAGGGRAESQEYGSVARLGGWVGGGRTVRLPCRRFLWAKHANRFDLVEKASRKLIR